MKKYLYLIMLCLASVATQAKGGLLWKAARTGAAAYAAHFAFKNISDDLADKIADKVTVRYKRWRNPKLSEKAAHRETDNEQVDLKNVTGVKHESFVRFLLALGAFELSKGILDGYVYESLMG